MKKQYVLDTSALLNDPQSLFSFPKSEMLVPQVVLSELDRLKNMRADKSIIYRGREVSRLLFDLSEQGKLSDGIKVKGGSVVRVIPASLTLDVPRGLNLKNSDDVILSTVNTLNNLASKEEMEVTLLTNDLNMLVKAATLGLNVERIKEKPIQESFLRRVFVRHRVRLAMGVLTVLIVAMAASLSYLWWSGTAFKGPSSDSVQQEEFQIRESSFKKILQDNPNDVQALVGLGNLYFTNKRDGQAVIYFHRALSMSPEDLKVRTDMGTAYLNLGYPDIALREYEKVLENNPSFASAHYFSGLAFEKKGGSSEAVNQYQLYLDQEPKGSYSEDAQKRITRLKGS